MTEDRMKGLFGGGEAEAAPETERDARRAARDARREARGARRSAMSADDKSRAEDFVKRYTSGSPTEDFSSEEAVGYLRQLREEVPPEVLQRAAVSTVQNLPGEQRQAFAEMLQRRQQGTGMVTIERTGEARAAQSRGGADGGEMGMDDVLGGLFGGLLGGGSPEAAPEPAPRTRQVPQGEAGTDDLIGGLLGSLLGGGATQAPRGDSAAGDPFGGILGSLLGGDAAVPHEEPASRQREQPQGGGINDILGSPMGKAILGGIAAYAMKELMDKDRKG